MAVPTALQFANNIKRKQAIAAELEALAKTIRQPAQARRDIVAQLPHVSLNVLDLPDELQRQLFDAFQLEIRYDRHRQHVTIKVAIHAEMIDSLGRTAASLAGQAPIVPRRSQSTETETTNRAAASASARKSVPMFDVPPACPVVHGNGDHAGEVVEIVGRWPLSPR